MRRLWVVIEYSVPVSKTEAGELAIAMVASLGWNDQAQLPFDRIERHEIRRVPRMNYIDHSLQDYMMSALGSRLTSVVLDIFIR